MAIAAVVAAALAAAAAFASGIGKRAELSVGAGIGPNPELPPPERSLLPVIDIAPAVGWDEGGAPVAAEGLAVDAFASGFEHPRWLYVLPNGDVLVAESAAPPRETRSLKDRIFGLAMKRAGAAVPSADRIALLRDTNRDGHADERSVLISDLVSPFGMALVGDALYVANADALVRYRYAEGATSLAGPAEKVADLPGGPINHHWTKNVIASRDGRTLYVTVGSNSNIAENGIEHEENRAAILAIDAATGAVEPYATGLRNPNGLAWHPTTGALWTVVNERDGLGSDLVPDYLTSVERGAFYGWPYSYFGTHVDDRVEPQRPDLVAAARVPDYALGAHTASLGLVFDERAALPPPFRGGAFVSQHGSWNRRPLSGYKVIFVPFDGGRPSGPPVDVLTGFLSADGEAQGRPVGLAIDATGALLVADDVGNTIWRVVASRAAR